MLRLVAPKALRRSDLAGALGHRNQHDVDDADRAQRQRDQTYAAEEPIHGGENLAHVFLILNRVPLFPDVFSVGIEAAVVAGNDAVEFSFGGFVFVEAARLIVDERNSVDLLSSCRLSEERARAWY